MTWRAAGWASVLAIVLLGVLAPAVLAHPLGNFTANTAAALTVRADEVAIDYVLDLAEIPALQASQRMDVDDDGEVDEDELAAHAQERCQVLADGLVIDAANRSLPVAVERSSAGFPPGEAGLDTLRVVCRFSAPWELDEATTLTFVDTNTPDRIGWREVTAVGDGTTLVASDVPTASPTDLLQVYPEERLSTPLDVRSASLTVRPGGPRLAGTGDGGGEGPLGTFERLTTAYTDLVSERELTLGFGLFALALSLFLGALHALAPGHGKTVMAAYVVGQRGTTKQALLIGATVAATHTLGVLALGLAIGASESLAPESLYPWLGGLSGLLLVVIGIGLLRRSLATGRTLTAGVIGPAAEPVPALAGAGSGRAASTHDHAHGPAHEAHDRRHDHDHDQAHAHGHPHEHDHLHDHDEAAHGQAPHPGEDGVGVRRRDGWVEVAHAHGGASHVHLVPGEDAITLRSLVTLGVAGGLVPSPSALLVLLGAVALGRAWFGVGLVAAYGAGLAATLVIGGLLLVRLRDRAERWLARSGRVRNAAVARWLPVVTAGMVILGGIAVAARSLLLV